METSTYNIMMLRKVYLAFGPAYGGVYPPGSYQNGSKNAMAVMEIALFAQLNLGQK
jgi:hypothetical protein